MLTSLKRGPCCHFEIYSRMKKITNKTQPSTAELGAGRAHITVPRRPDSPHTATTQSWISSPVSSNIRIGNLHQNMLLPRNLPISLIFKTLLRWFREKDVSIHQHLFKWNSRNLKASRNTGRLFPEAHVLGLNAGTVTIAGAKGRRECSWQRALRCASDICPAVLCSTKRLSPYGLVTDHHFSPSIRTFRCHCSHLYKPPSDRATWLSGSPEQDAGSPKSRATQFF